MTTGAGHKQMCKKIHRGGNAEAYIADKKCEEAIAVAASVHANDTAGQACYICTQALHWKTKEGLVRMCACRGTAGFAHVSCLAEQARILNDEAEANNLGTRRRLSRGRNGKNAACANSSTWASCGARSGGRAGGPANRNGQTEGIGKRWRSSRSA